ncbi:hypothetical protein PHYBOEH_006369 [Phytophthora boehmeriae]|uniref:Uncharacterized protein n=1 Tax=Phytophthora boehmeriae TaxID=109152 RepID=A0A8T1WJ89_9STRA|nr:hypothetical protein PHYBOEH_006369 [Phytophthora boehmeriae]
MLPIEVRKCREPDGQQQYTSFRNTVFTHKEDELADRRGPGALFRKEWNSLAGNAERYKSLSLYRTEREVNPTRTVVVQRFYDPQQSTDLSTQLKRKGNAVTALKSAVPRFHEKMDGSERGPGSYFPDRYIAAFPTLFDKMTPRTVQCEKLEAKRSLDATFGIGIVPAQPERAAISAQTPRRGSPFKFRTGSGRDLNTLPDTPLEAKRLTVALTPRNVYQNDANRQFILNMRQSESAPSPLDSTSPT